MNIIPIVIIETIALAIQLLVIFSVIDNNFLNIAIALLWICLIIYSFGNTVSKEGKK